MKAQSIARPNITFTEIRITTKHKKITKGETSGDGDAVLALEAEFTLMDGVMKGSHWKPLVEVDGERAVDADNVFGQMTTMELVNELVMRAGDMVYREMEK